MAEGTSAIDGGGGEGILLYYKYTPVPDVPALARLYESSCLSLGLLGRVRIGPDGVNCTVGGKLSSLEKHIAQMKSNSLFECTDFKLAPCDGPTDERIARECGFASLSVRVVKELVTFRSHPLLKSPNISKAGKHLSAAEFHYVLQGTGNVDSKGSVQNKQLLLLDARNLYETRIGMFQTPNVVTLNPRIRQYSDLPAWIDTHSELLRDHYVLISIGTALEVSDVKWHQPISDQKVLVLRMFTSYLVESRGIWSNFLMVDSLRERFLFLTTGFQLEARMQLLLDHAYNVVLPLMTIHHDAAVPIVGFWFWRAIIARFVAALMLRNQICASSSMGKSPEYVCELCLKHRKEGDPSPLMSDDQLLSELSSDLLGAVGQLELGPAIPSIHATPSHFLEFPAGDGTGSRKKLRILCLHGFRQNASGFRGRTASLAKKLKSIAELIFVDAPHELPFIYQARSSEQNCGSTYPSTMEVACSTQQPPPPCQYCKKKFAWLVSPISNYLEGSDWKVADLPFDPLQYQQQTDGFQESYTFLKKVFSQKGPFDGILGFSQGAAMAGLVCDQQWRPGSIPDFRFAILCSGFSLLTGERSHGRINGPSLHIYGSSRGTDRQIACQASIELANTFDRGCSVIIEHEMGHIIPTQTPYIDQMRAFLRGFLTL